MGDKGMGFPTDGIDNQGWKLYITSLVMIIAACLFVIARCAARYSIRRLGSDDIAIIASLVSSILTSIFIQIGIHHGYGMHKYDLTKHELQIALKMFFIAQTPYKATVGLNKVSAILLYLRIFVTRPFRVWSYIVMGVVVGYSIAGIGATIWQCVPIAGAWDKTIKATCIDSNKFWVAYAVLNVVTDVMVLALPIPPIVRLQTNIREKILLGGIFLLGSFVTLTSVLRVTSVSNSLKNKEDITYNFIERGIWTLTEANLGIITACLPVLRQPLGKRFPRIFGTTKERSAYLGGVVNGSRGYKLSNLSTRTSNLNLRLWRGAGSKSSEVISITRTEADVNGEQESDEERIITGSVEGGDVKVYSHR